MLFKDPYAADAQHAPEAGNPSSHDVKVFAEPLVAAVFSSTYRLLSVTLPVVDLSRQRSTSSICLSLCV